MSTFRQSVLFVGHDASRTGAPIFLLRFLRWFRDHLQIPFQIVVVSPGELLKDFASVAPTHVLEPESKLDRILQRLHLPGRDNSQHLASLRKRLAEADIGLIYSNTTSTGRALDYLSFLNCPVLCHVHELEQALQHCNKDENLSMVKRHASSYIAVSHAVKRNLVLNHGIREDAIDVIHGFVPTGDRVARGCGDARALVRRELRIPTDARLVCACGSVEARKGCDLFLQVADRFARKHRSLTTHFVWIGGAKEKVRAIREQVKKYSLGNLVHFIGNRRDTGPYYEASDVFLLPSREDPFPLVMLEAALRGKPIVCFDNSGGAPEFVQHDAGFIVPAFDVGAMAAKLAVLLTSDRLCRRMGEAGRRRVLERHDINTSAPKVAAMMQNLMLSAEKIAQPSLSTVHLG